MPFNIQIIEQSCKTGKGLKIISLLEKAFCPEGLRGFEVGVNNHLKEKNQWTHQNANNK